MLPELKIYTTVSDLKYIMFEHPDIISDQIKTEGVWNLNVLSISQKILTNSAPGIVIDIGAGFGTFSVHLASMNYRNFKFAAFEPLRIVNMQLATNVLLNHLDNIKVFNVGLGEREETRSFYTVDYALNANHGSFSFNHEINEIRGILPTDDREMYEFKTLDSYLPGNVRLIKLSAPGMEIEVLRGSTETIKNNDCPPLIFESWQDEWYKDQTEQIYKFLSDVGYAEFEIIDNYIIAFKNIAEKTNLLRDRQKTMAFTDFNINEKSHDAAETIKDQKPLII